MAIQPGRIIRIVARHPLERLGLFATVFAQFRRPANINILRRAQATALSGELHLETCPLSRWRQLSWRAIGRGWRDQNITKGSAVKGV